MMSLKLSKLSIAIVGVMLSGASIAADGQDQNSDKSGAKQQGQTEGVINAGGLEIKPTLSLMVGKNDNVGLANPALAAVRSATFTKLAPKVVVEMPTHGQVYSATYSGTYAQYSGVNTDNYNDHNFGLAANNDWSTRVNSLINVDYNKGHDGRNVLPTGNQFLEHWHTTGIKGMAHYGADGAQGQFEVTAGQLIKRYDSNNSGLTQRMNTDTTNLLGAFFYKIAPATNMIFQLGNTKIAYADPAVNTRDSNELQYMMGVKWDATAKTTGSFKIGQVRKSFVVAGTPSSTNTAWDSEVIWSPLTYSNVNISLHQKAAESFGTGSFVIARDSNIDWTHEWTGHVKSKLSFGDGNDTYQNSTQVNKRQTYGGKLTYEINRWLNAGIDYQNAKRTSNVAAMSYTQNITMLILEGSL